MNDIKKAIILAAGLGSRLKPLTDEVPKCLTEVNGKAILEHSLSILEKNGIDETVVVVGYLGDIVIDGIGHKYGNMKITHLWNEIYDDTNSMYSAWLAREYLEQGTLLIEGDTVFEEALIKEVLQTPQDKTFWVGDRFRREYLGSMSITDSKNRIIDLKIVREELKEYKSNYYKSTGILKITPEYGKMFSKWLDDDVKKGNVQIYYDIVIREHLKDVPIYVCDITGGIWNEIDSLEDLKKTEKIFIPTKYVIIILDGAADLPISELHNKTPLEAARIPNIDNLAKNGKTGLMRTMYPGLPVGSIVANMGILGYNPARYYPNGRASFEALAQDIFLDESDIAFRCNLVSLQDGKLKDFTASNISDEEARKIIGNLELSDDSLSIYPGQSYRNIMIVKGVNCNVSEITASEPHMNIERPVEGILLKGSSTGSIKIAKKLNRIMLDSIEKIKKLNEKFKTPADMLFLWSPSSEPRIPSFHRKFGIDGAIISGLDFMRGIGVAARMEARKIPGATGYSDTNLKEKLRYVQDSLRYNDLVYLHINAPDEESHQKKIWGKVKIIEKIDKEIVEPIKEYLEHNYPNKYRLAILPDHYTLLKNGEHSDALVPYLIYGKGIKRDYVRKFAEKDVGEKSRTIIKSYEFMDFLMRGS